MIFDFLFDAFLYAFYLHHFINLISLYYRWFLIRMLLLLFRPPVAVRAAAAVGGRHLQRRQDDGGRVPRAKDDVGTEDVLHAYRSGKEKGILSLICGVENSMFEEVLAFSHPFLDKVFALSQPF